LSIEHVVNQQLTAFHHVCRYTWGERGAKNTDGANSDVKGGVTAMISSNGEGKMLPLLICVAGSTFVSLDKFVAHDPEAWNAPGQRKGQARKAFLKNVCKQNNCAMKTGTTV
jgi:hypothetical protein